MAISVVAEHYAVTVQPAYDLFGYEMSLSSTNNVNPFVPTTENLNFGRRVGFPISTISEETFS